MLKKIFVLFLFLSASSCLYSQDTASKHPIDLFLDSCMAKDYSTMGMIDCTGKAKEMWDAEMNKYYNLLDSLLEAGTFGKLRDSQKEWLKFRDNENAFIDTFYDEVYTKMGGGTIYSLFSASDKTEIIRRRALQLQSYYKSITGQWD